MDIFLALDGAYSGMASASHADHAAVIAQWAIIRSLERLADAVTFALPDGGNWRYETISELEPTFFNEWDYEWPNDFDTKPSILYLN